MKIQSIESIPVSVPVSANLVIRSALGVHKHSHFVLVKIHTDEGITGLGEASVSPAWSGETQAGTKAVIDQYLAPCLAGEDPTAIERLAVRMEAAVRFNWFAKAALEMALYDISAKAAGVPAYQLLGGKVRSRIRLKCSVSAADPQGAAQMAVHFVSLGMRTLKVKVGLDPAADIERVEAVRAAVGEGVRLGIDGNGGWTVSDAVLAINRMERYGVAFCEQPVSPANVHWMAAVKRRTRVPVVADESVFSLADALAVIEHHAADVLNIYPGKNGGIGVSKKVAAVAEAAGRRCLIGSNLELGVASAAMIHLACSTPVIDSELWPADIIGPLYHPEDVLATPLAIQDGFVAVPDGPGLGVELDERCVERFRVR